MPYQVGTRLPGERGSKLGHLEMLKSELVNRLINQFEYPPADEKAPTTGAWQTFDRVNVAPLRLVLAVDGSMQTLRSERIPKRELAFVKTALIRLDPRAIEKLDPEYPHPLHLKQLMSDAALHHSTVFPLKNVSTPPLSNYDAVRGIIRDSIKDPSLDGIIHETLKWLAYQKWTGDTSIRSPGFGCPHCKIQTAGIEYDLDNSVCEHCNCEVYLSDMIGFHLEMGEDAAPDSLASAYMLVHETLLLFSFIRHYWEAGWKKDLAETLFIKDGPLTLRGQYSKLVILIRNFLEFAKNNECPIHIMGQEKTGVLVDHLETFAKQIKPDEKAESPSFAILSHTVVQKEIYRIPDPKNLYGSRTNYGEKLFVKLDPFHQMVISVPTGAYVEEEDFPNQVSDFIGLERILATLPSLISYRHQCALVPVELANGVASLSSYPSAAILKVFAGIDKP
jgi:hypothetical protein